MDVLILSLGLVIMTGVAIAINYKHIKYNRSNYEEKEFLLSVLNRPKNPIVIFSQDRETLFISESARKQFAALVKNPKIILQFNPKTKLLPPPYDNIAVKKTTSLYHQTRYDIFTLITDDYPNTENELDEHPIQADQDLSDIENFSQLTHQVATTDPLTELPNEYEAITKLTALIQTRNETQMPFNVFILGIDHFNEISITLGYGLTNRLIKEVANFLKEHVSEMFLYRLQCDKFLLIAPESFSSMSELHIFARDFLTLFNSKNICNQEIRLSGSLGISKFPDDGNYPARLLENAFSALNKAQDDNESNFEIYKGEDNISHFNEMKINDEIVKGLKNKEFILHYQPIIDIKDGKNVGVEVLLRWNHPQHGLLTPDKFLDIAEKTGLVIDIGEYVFKEAAKQKKEWNDAGLGNLVFTINLSVREMQIASLILKLEKYLSEYHLQPNEFNLDITEEAAMLHFKETQRDIKLFNESGIYLTLDQFGSGLFSISHLQNLPLNVIKLDKSLTLDIETNPEHQKIVKSIVALAHSLNIEVAAEAVESKSIADALTEIGCRYAQGYYFSKPLNAEEYVNFYKQHQNR